MKITSLVIKPEHAYRDYSGENPLKATVTLKNNCSSVETVIPEHMIPELLTLVQDIVARAAKEGVDDFCAAVSAVEGSKAKAIEGAT